MGWCRVEEMDVGREAEIRGRLSERRGNLQKSVASQIARDGIYLKL
jgi:hypothetical protein